jgi:FtsZ-interacting cell division protein ZipA
MDTWVWILIAVGAVIIVGLVILAARKGRERRLESKRHEALELRREAQATEQRAEQRASVADELAERSQLERRQARAEAQRANEVDPDVDD